MTAWLYVLNSKVIITLQIPEKVFRSIIFSLICYYHRVFRRVTVQESQCRNACSLSLYLLCLSMWCLFCGCWSEVWPVAVLKAACDVSGMEDKDKQLNSDRHTNSTVYYLSWNCCHFQVKFFGTSSASYKNFLHFHSALLYWNHFIWTVQGSAWVLSSMILFAYDFPLWMWKFQSEIYKRFSFLRRNQGEEILKGRAVWNGSWCYISTEPLNHAAHVTGPLYSCHCAQQQMR